MKNIIKHIFTIFSVSAFLFACVDEDKIRYEIDDFEKIVNLRISSNVSTFDASNEEASATLTFYSENNEDIAEVELFLDHYIFLEDSTSDRVSILTVPGSDITNNGSTTFSFTLSELAEAVGITQSDLAGGDILTLHNITTMKNGKVYPDTVLAGTDFETINISPTISQSAPTTSFTSAVSFPIVCELPEGFGTGEYLLEVLEGSNTGFGVSIIDDNQVVNIIADGNTGRTFDFGYLTGLGFSSTMTFNFACNIVLVPTTGAGLGCGAGLVWAIDTSDPGTFNITDDSQFTINILHNVLGDCGLPTAERYSLRLTKQ